MFLGLTDPHLDPLVTSKNPDADTAPDPPFSHISVGPTEIIKKNLVNNVILII
jgi:hypothetical protein